MSAAKKKPAKKAAAKRTGGRTDTASRDVVCRTFAAAYLRYGNATRAFREAVPHSQANDNTAYKEAHYLLYDERTQRYIDELRKRAAARVEATLAEWIANELRIARFDPARLFDADGSLLPVAEMDPDTRFAIQAVDVEEEKVERHEDEGVQVVTRTRVKKIKAHAKDGAQERLGKHLGAYLRDNEQQNVMTQLLAKVPAAQLGVLEEILRGCGGNAGNGGAASAGSPAAAPRSGH